jgi:hypothetical protein
VGDSGFYFFDVGGHLGSPRCCKPNGWVIGALGFFVVVLVYLFLFFGFPTVSGHFGSSRLLWVVIVFLGGFVDEHKGFVQTT